MNLLYFLAHAHSTCFTVFLRHSFGVEGLAGNAVAALLMMLGFAALAPAPEMFVFAGLWLVVLACRRFHTWRLVQRGWVAHSRYGGWPWAALLLPFVRTEAKARAMEPGLCLLAGMLLYPLSPAVGGFVLLGAPSLAVTWGIESRVTQMRVRRMRDAEIEQRQLAERFRGPGDDF